MLGDIFKRKGVVVGSILFGTLIGGSIGVYIRDNWDIQARVSLKCIELITHVSLYMYM